MSLGECFDKGTKAELVNKKRKADKDNNKAPAKQHKKATKESKFYRCPACGLKDGEIPVKAHWSAFCGDCSEKWSASFCDGCSYFTAGSLDDDTNMCETCIQAGQSPKCPDCGQLYYGDAWSPEYEPHVCAEAKFDEDQPGSSKSVLGEDNEDAMYALIQAMDDLKEAAAFGTPDELRVPDWKNVAKFASRVAEIAKPRARAQDKS